MISSALMTSPLWAAAFAGLLAAAVIDCRRRIIPNRIVLLIATCGIVIRLLFEPTTLVLSIFLAVAILLVLGLLARRELIGGGDAKLITAVTLMVRPSEIAALLLAIALSGGLLSLIYMVLRYVVPTSSVSALAPSLPEPHARAPRVDTLKSIPYGVAVLGGTAYVVGTKALRWLHATS